MPRRHMAMHGHHLLIFLGACFLSLLSHSAFACSLSEFVPLPLGDGDLLLPPTSANQFCKSKGFAMAGNKKIRTLGELEGSLKGKLSALDLGSGKKCSTSTCEALIALECVPRGASPCSPDANGNIGTDNIGTGNFGVGNSGNGNIGLRNKGNGNVGIDNDGLSLTGVRFTGIPGEVTSLEGGHARQYPLTLKKLSQLLPKSSKYTEKATSGGKSNNKPKKVTKPKKTASSKVSDFKNMISNIPTSKEAVAKALNSLNLPDPFAEAKMLGTPVVTYRIVTIYGKKVQVPVVRFKLLLPSIDPASFSTFLQKALAKAMGKVLASQFKVYHKLAQVEFLSVNGVSVNGRMLLGGSTVEVKFTVSSPTASPPSPTASPPPPLTSSPPPSSSPPTITPPPPSSPVTCSAGEYIKNGVCTKCIAICNVGEYLGGISCSGLTTVDTVQCTSCKSCSAGKYKSDVCDGTSTFDKVVCSDCSATCSSGKYMNKSACDGTTETNGAVCSACTCSSGEYITDKSACTGSTDTNGAVCSACTCSNGYYITDTSACTGSTETNGAACSACTASCSSGKYIDKSACTGSTSTNGAVCSACTASCSSGEYINKSACDGTTETNGAVCSACTCSSGEYITDKSACTGSTSTNGAACSACTASCCSGKYIDKSACTGSTSTNGAVCSACTASCSSGEYINKSACTGSTSTNGAVCSTCTATCTADEFLDASACNGSTSANGAVCKEKMKLVFDLSKGSSSTEICVPLRGTVDVIIDWGDGSPETVQSSGVKCHTYTATGQVTVKISGSMSAFGSDATTNYDKLISVEKFGDLGITLWSYAFCRASNLVSVPSTIPSGATHLDSMFVAASLFDQDLSNWDVSSVTNMGGMFVWASAFNSPLAWGSKTSEVTSMYGMFMGANKFSQDISGWDVSKVTHMGYMFHEATAFNQPLNAWGSMTSNVEVMNNMFYDAQNFNQDVSSWDVSKVTDMNRMFYNALAFNSPLNGWGSKTALVTNMSDMFNYANAFNQDISGWSQNASLTCTDFIMSLSTLLCSNIPAGALQSCASTKCKS